MLGWEARYRKGEYLTGNRSFLPELDLLDKDFAKALEFFGIIGGRLLDIGTGLGMQAIRYAQLGFDVTATDVSPTSIEIARINAAKESIDPGLLTLVTDNILASALEGPFDLIADRGCYTLLKDWMLEDYCSNVHRLLSPNGLFLLKVDAGKNEKTKFIETYFRILQSWNTNYHGKQKQGPKADFFILKSLPE